MWNFYSQWFVTSYVICAEHNPKKVIKNAHIYTNHCIVIYYHSIILRVQSDFNVDLFYISFYFERLFVVSHYQLV